MDPLKTVVAFPNFTMERFVAVGRRTVIFGPATESFTSSLVPLMKVMLIIFSSVPFALSLILTVILSCLNSYLAKKFLTSSLCTISSAKV